MRPCAGHRQQTRSSRGKLESACQRGLMLIATGGGAAWLALSPANAIGQAAPSYRINVSSAYPSKNSTLNIVYTADNGNGSNLNSDTIITTDSTPTGITPPTSITGVNTNVETNTYGGGDMTFPTGTAAANPPVQFNGADVVTNGPAISSTTAAAGMYAYTDTVPGSYNMELVLAPGSGVSQTNVPGDLFSVNGASEVDLDVNAIWQLGTAGFSDLPGLMYQFPLNVNVGIGGVDHVIANLNIYYDGETTPVGSISQDVKIDNTNGTQSLSVNGTLATSNTLSGYIPLNDGTIPPSGTFAGSATTPPPSNFMTISGTITFKAKNNGSPSFTMFPQASLFSAPQQSYSAWNLTGSGTWDNATSWTAGVPNSSTSAAFFGNTITATSGITLESSKTVGSVTFDSPISYFITPAFGGVSLILDNAASGGSIMDEQGSHEIFTAVVLDSNTTIDVVNSGDSLEFDCPISGTGQLTVTGSGTTILAGNSQPIGYGGGTVINGNLQLGDGSNVGFLAAGAVTDDGTLLFDEPSAYLVVDPNNITGFGGVTQEGAGGVTLSGTNSFTGPVVVGAGTILHLGSTSALGAGNVTVNGKLDLAGFSPVLDSLSGSGTVDNVSAGGNVTLTVDGVGSSVFSGDIKNTTGTVGLSLAGGGTLTLTNANTYSGQTTVKDSMLILDNTTTGASSIISNSSGLVMGGGTLQLNTASHLNQSFALTTFNPGQSILTDSTNTFGLVKVNLGTVTRGGQGAIVQFNGPVSGTASSFQVASNAVAPAILASGGSDYATFGTSDWAATTASNGGNAYIVPGSAISGFYTSQGSGEFVSSENTDVVGAGLISAPPGSSATSMRFNTPTGGLINLGLNDMDQFFVIPTFACGGYLVTPNVGANNILISDLRGASYQANFLGTQDITATTSTTPQDIVIWQNNTAGLLIFNTGITDGSAPGSGLTKAGPGTLVMNAASTYTGATYIEGGAIEISSGAALGGLNAGGGLGQLNFDGGTLVAVNNLSLDISGTHGLVARNIAFGTYGGNLVAATGATLTVDGSISGNGPVHFGSTATFNTAIASASNSSLSFGQTTGNGTVILNGNSTNTFTGPIVIESGTLQVGDGTTSSSLGPGDNGIANNGNLAFDLPAGTAQTVTMPISGIGGVTQSGAGSTLTLSNYNTYLSPTVISAGTLNITGVGSLPSGGQVANNGTLNIQAVSQAGNITGTGTTVIRSNVALNTGNIAQSTVVNNGSLIVYGNATLPFLSGTGAIANESATSVSTIGSLVQGAVTNNGILSVTGLGQFGPITGTGSLIIGIAVVQLTPSSGPSNQDSLTLNAGATLDITNNRVTINYAPAPSPLPTIETELAAGTITSSDLRPGYAIGYADGSLDPGTAVPASTLVMVPALIGDANLDGVVNLTDLLTVLNNYGESGQDWAHGDFNYDGDVNLTDLLGLLNNYGESGGGLGAEVVVPEPALGGLFLGLLGVLALGRRSKPQRALQNGRRLASAMVHLGNPRQ